ncbi:MAG: putative RNA-binding protein [Promethearchaeota archaeon]|nr:MAG: putative RNA-binding protein [Candidatus Lokiarchaeota archaeon]
MPDRGVFIRGIYSTALTKLFMDLDYKIVFPSPQIRDRFGIPYQNNLLSKDITINDRDDKQGISIKIKKEFYNELSQSDFEMFPLTLEKEPYLIRLNSNFNVNDIYGGEVIKSNKEKNYSLVKLADEDNKERSKFSTNLGYFDSFMKKGIKRIFQVRREDFSSHAAELVEGYTLPGDFLVLLPEADKVFISKKIYDSQERKRLNELGNTLLEEKDFGIICRTAAKFAKKEDIERELNELENSHQKILKLISKMQDTPGIIFSISKSINLLFSAPFKKKLDKIRSKVISTIHNHHTIKSLSTIKRRMGKYSADDTEFLDYTEDLVESIKRLDKEKIETFYLENYFERIQEGKWMRINHQKLSGKNFHLRGGKIKSFKKMKDSHIEIELRREFESGGKYDGLDIPIGDGDFALSTYKEGQWYYLNEYYSNEGKLKGKYINFNTPIEISNRSINYIDLEVDVIEKSGEKMRIIDLEEFEQLFELNLISQVLYEKIKNLLDNLGSNHYFS